LRWVDLSVLAAGGVQVLIAVGAALAVLVTGILAFDRTD
jgi:hypothetical protein